MASAALEKASAPPVDFGTGMVPLYPPSSRSAPAVCAVGPQPSSNLHGREGHGRDAGWEPVEAMAASVVDIMFYKVQIMCYRRVTKHRSYITKRRDVKACKRSQKPEQENPKGLRTYTKR